MVQECSATPPSAPHMARGRGAGTMIGELLRERHLPDHGACHDDGPFPASPDRHHPGPPARVYDWLLGGKDNYPVDEAVGETLPPEALDAARQDRAFTNRAVAHPRPEGRRPVPGYRHGHPDRAQPPPDRPAGGADGQGRLRRQRSDRPAACEAPLVAQSRGATDYIQADVREPDEIVRHAREILTPTGPSRCR